VSEFLDNPLNPKIDLGLPPKVAQLPTDTHALCSSLVSPWYRGIPRWKPLQVTTAVEDVAGVCGLGVPCRPSSTPHIMPEDARQGHWGRVGHLVDKVDTAATLTHW
jgi:hypothetical protein